ncbi:Zn-dependent hydrolase [Paracoccus sediminicola]|uniref:Zn-dependent hydrolase n=1 Tax=Paracoccus sediminicola TaxID=3017783 RepID=UPI0022F02ACA|nr:Zn-dependent hydrolase [Paracoccus sediminicola]WBU56121.1 Zn-dependent hydrolase [Paracoccus sediminicola]
MTAPGFAINDDDAAWAAELFEKVAAMSPDSAGVSRPALSEVETRVLDFLDQRASEAGLETWRDPAQNSVYARPGQRDAVRYILTGSHVDSVPQGGNFDGLAGVVASLLCLRAAEREGLSLPMPVHAIAMRAEESAWFGPCYIASKMLTGSLEDDEAASLHKGDGRALGDHLADLGIPVDKLRAKVPLAELSRIAAYLELHIEQGPLLAERDLPAAAVSGIRGNLRFRNIIVTGEPGHSGAVPRAYRRDPVMAMADLLHRLDESWSTIVQTGGDLVLTSGMLGTDPERHALSRIPDSVSFSLDIRSQDSQTLSGMQGLLDTEIEDIARRRKVSFDTGPASRNAPALMDPGMIAGLKTAMDALGMEPLAMPSGGGHDAAVFANAGIPAGMVFVRNRNGSHNPDEAMEIEDLVAGARIMLQYLMTPQG